MWSSPLCEISICGYVDRRSSAGTISRSSAKAEEAVHSATMWLRIADGVSFIHTTTSAPGDAARDTLCPTIANPLPLHQP